MDTIAPNNQIMPLDSFGKMAEVFKGESTDVSHFTAGIGQSWPTLTFKGKVWGTRFRGENKEVTAPNEQAGGAIMPVQFLDVVVVDAGQRISKAYYKEGFKDDGSHAPPDCWSVDALTPDPGAPDKQSPTCAGCRHNVMNSRVDEKGKGRGKECSDNKRLAVVSLNDIPSKTYGGPLMLKLPPGSFTNYTQFVNIMHSKGYLPYAVAVRLTFDHQAAHPKIVFTPIRPLMSDEGAQVLELRTNPIVQTMLNDKSVAAFADPDAGREEGEPEGLPAADAPAPEGWEGKPKGKGLVEQVDEIQQAASAALKEIIQEVLPPGITQEIWDQLPDVARNAMRAAMPKPEPVKPKIALPPGMTQVMFDSLPGSVQAAMYQAQAEPALLPPTPEELQAQAKAAATKPKGTRGRPPRSNPVAPPASTAAPVTPPSNGADNGQDQGDAITNNLNERIAKVSGVKPS